MGDTFNGIAEKLNRSHENIRNLEAEIARFFEDSEYPVLCDDNQQMITEAIEYHRDRTIPPRFGVLAGEIIHHLRSCLDHIVWIFSDTTYRQKNRRWIEFPILKARPLEKDLFARYERKVKGVGNPVVRNKIENLQPYNRPDPIDSHLLIIHNFDIIDKHRELVVVFSTGAIQLPIEVWDRYVRYECGVPGSEPVDFKREFERNGKIVPQVAFSDFGRAESEPVVQGLTELQNFVVDLAKMFEGLE